MVIIIIILLSLSISEDSDQGNNRNKVSTLEQQVASHPTKNWGAPSQVHVSLSEVGLPCFLLLHIPQVAWNVVLYTWINALLLLIF